MPNGYIGQIHVNQTDYKIGSTLFAILNNSDNPEQKIGSIDIEDGIATFIVPLDGFALSYGVTIHIQFRQSWTNSENSTALLKVGNTEARPIINPNGAITWGANSVISFTYDGTYYVMNTVGFDASNVTIDVSNLSSLTLGNIQSTGTLQTGADVDIERGDKLVITDSSDGNKITRSSLEFSASISLQGQGTRFLREDGSWAAPSYTTNTNRSIKINGIEKLSSSSSTPLDLKGGDGISITNIGGEVTIANILTASDLGLSAALRFVGITTTDMYDGYKGIPPEGIPDYTSPQVGDVVIHGDEEYVYVKREDSTEENTTYYEWELLGRDSSFALNDAVIHNSLLDTTGDIIYKSSSGIDKLGIGSAGQVLTVSGGVPVWADNQATDNKVAQVLDTSSNQYALLFSDNQTSATTATITTGAKRNNNIYVTPSEGSITATKFIGTLRASDVKSALGTGTESGLIFLHKSGEWKTLSIPTIASVSNGTLTITNVALSVT